MAIMMTTWLTMARALWGLFFMEAFSVRLYEASITTDSVGYCPCIRLGGRLSGQYCCYQIVIVASYIICHRPIAV